MFDEIEQAWRERHGSRHCWLCRERLATDLHHIERRSHGGAGAHIPANWFAACRECHDGPLATMDHAEQLALKMLADDDSYDLTEWRAITGRNVTQEEVNACAEQHIGGFVDWLGLPLPERKPAGVFRHATLRRPRGEWD